LQASFPALALAQVYGAIAYYLEHRQALDARFAVEDQEYYQQWKRDREADPDFYRRLYERRANMRRRLGVPDNPVKPDNSDTPKPEAH
jgi:hypothetical protein